MFHLFPCFDFDFQVLTESLFRSVRYDVVEYFNLEAGDEGVLGSEDFKAILTSTDKSTTSNISKMEVRYFVVWSFV